MRRITLRQLSVVKGEFARVLGGMYHGRVDYPTPTVPIEAVPDEPRRGRRRDGVRIPVAAIARRRVAIGCCGPRAFGTLWSRSRS